MTISNHLSARALAAVLAVGALGAAAPGAGAAPFDPSTLTPVAGAQPKTTGVSLPNVLSPELAEAGVAHGSMPLDGASAELPFYGYDAYAADGQPAPFTGDASSPRELLKTEPDKNTYLVLDGLRGPDASYDYGRHFLFQGHEGGHPGAITRINLDADAAHRVSLLAQRDVTGKDLPDFDGSVWDPFTKRLLFTAEAGANGGVWESDLDVPAHVRDISWALGRGGYEGIQADSDGNLWIVEDVGGKAGAVNTHAKQPNSFLYRFVPADPRDLSQGGRLQALQVTSKATGSPVTFHAGQADADILSPETRDVHTYGTPERTRWITIHDTATDTSGQPFDANALAKAAGATPFKRPENGQFRPGSGFRQFLFDETGDTNAQTEAGADYGGFGGVQVLYQKSPSADTGVLRLLYQGDVAHTGFDNVTFLSRDDVAFVEDAGDTLHTQRDALDSGYVLDYETDYSGGAQPKRFLAEGRDPSATYDADHSGTGNDGDNEITGIHASNGDPSVGGLIGTRAPTLFENGWRLFWTQQHGDNTTWEITPAG